MRAHKWDACLPFLACAHNRFCKTLFMNWVAIQCWHWNCDVCAIANQVMTNPASRYWWYWWYWCVSPSDCVVWPWYHGPLFLLRLRTGSNKITGNIWRRYCYTCRKEKSAVTRKGGFSGPTFIWFFFFICGVYNLLPKSGHTFKLHLTYMKIPSHYSNQGPIETPTNLVFSTDHCSHGNTTTSFVMLTSPTLKW
jgi:hypothetical protein